MAHNPKLAKPFKGALELLLKSSDPKVRESAEVIAAHWDRRTYVLSLVREALSQLRVDMKYLIFDLEATRRERDEARGKV